MKVSVALHSAQPDEAGNQRQHETWYGGYNRLIADMNIDPATGNGIVILEKTPFPIVNTDPMVATHLSFAEAHAAEGYGGNIIIAGPFEQPLQMILGQPVVVDFAAGVYAQKLKALGAIKQEADGTWVELTEAELRARPIIRQ